MAFWRGEGSCFWQLVVATATAAEVARTVKLSLVLNLDAAAVSGRISQLQYKLQGGNSGVNPEHANYRGSCLGNHSTFAPLDDFHGHLAQLVIDPTPSQQRPPIVKIDLHRSPHGHPSGNRKALPYNGSPSALLMT